MYQYKKIFKTTQHHLIAMAAKYSDNINDELSGLEIGRNNIFANNLGFLQTPTIIFTMPSR